jgi:hypothetical protein
VLIFNTSFYVSEGAVEAWKVWLNEQLFSKVDQQVGALPTEVFEVVSARPEENRIFSVQWRCSDLGQIQQVDDCVASVLSSLKALFGESATHFSSIMKKL